MKNKTNLKGKIIWLFIKQHQNEQLLEFWRQHRRNLIIALTLIIAVLTITGFFLKFYYIKYTWSHPQATWDLRLRPYQTVIFEKVILDDSEPPQEIYAIINARSGSKLIEIRVQFNTDESETKNTFTAPHDSKWAEDSAFSDQLEEITLPKKHVKKIFSFEGIDVYRVKEDSEFYGLYSNIGVIQTNQDYPNKYRTTYSSKSLIQLQIYI